MLNPDYALGFVMKENKTKRMQRTEKIYRNNSPSYCEDKFFEYGSIVEIIFFWNKFLYA